MIARDARTDVVPMAPPDGDRSARQRRSANLRTALILLSIAAVFFVGIIVKRMMMG